MMPGFVKLACSILLCVLAGCSGPVLKHPAGTGKARVNDLTGFWVMEGRPNRNAQPLTIQITAIDVEEGQYQAEMNPEREGGDKIILNFYIKAGHLNICYVSIYKEGFGEDFPYTMAFAKSFGDSQMVGWAAYSNGFRQAIKEERLSGSIIEDDDYDLIQIEASNEELMKFLAHEDLGKYIKWDHPFTLWKQSESSLDD